MRLRKKSQLIYGPSSRVDTPAMPPLVKERKELFLAKTLLDRLGIEATVTNNSTPEPDVLAITSEGKRYGIELTGIDLGEGDRSHAIQPSLQKIGRKAAEAHLASGAPRRHATFTWAMGIGAFPVKMADELGVILRKATEGIPLERGQYASYSPKETDHEFIRASLVSITVALCDEGETEPRWRSQHSFGLTYAPLSLMESSLARKSGKPAGYLASYTEIWLLTHSGWESMYTERLMTDMVNSHEFTSPFNRVYYMPVSDELVQLHVKRP